MPPKVQPPLNLLIQNVCTFISFKPFIQFLFRRGVDLFGDMFPKSRMQPRSIKKRKWTVFKHNLISVLSCNQLIYIYNLLVILRELINISIVILHP